MRILDFNAVEYRVFDQIQKDQNFRSQYAKLAEQKVGLFASKLFIFISDDSSRVQVRELNFIERILRVIGFYSDSVFAPEQLKTIKSIFNKACSQTSERPKAPTLPGSSTPKVPFPVKTKPENVHKRDDDTSLPRIPSDLEETEPDTEKEVDPKKIDCVGVRLNKKLKKRVSKEVRTLQREFKKINEQAPKTQQALHIKHGQLEEFQQKFSKFATSIQKPIAKAMRNAVAKAMREEGVTEDALTAYLNDPRQGEQRIYNQTQLFMPTNPYTKLAKQLSVALEQSRESVLSTILSKYNPQECGGGGDCLFHSCARLAPEKDAKTWRREIAAKIKQEEATYGNLVNFRLQDDNFVSHIATHQQYADWIAGQGQWGSEPELQAFSDITGRPVLVVQKLGEGFFTLRKGFNLSIDKEPLVLFNLREAHYQAGVAA